jgi:hypothetical protein
MCVGCEVAGASLMLTSTFTPFGNWVSVAVPVSPLLFNACIATVMVCGAAAYETAEVASSAAMTVTRVLIDVFLPNEDVAM